MENSLLHHLWPLRILCDGIWALLCLPVFQSLSDDMLKDMLDKFVIAHISDILIYCVSLHIHVTHVRQVLSCLLENQLYIKGEKCEFPMPEILFLGYFISQEGVTMDEAKVAAVTEWRIPKTRTCPAF